MTATILFNLGTLVGLAIGLGISGLFASIVAFVHASALCNHWE